MVNFEQIIENLKNACSFRSAYASFKDVTFLEPYGRFRRGDKLKFIIACVRTNTWYWIDENNQRHVLSDEPEALKVDCDVIFVFIADVIVNKPFAGLKPDDILKNIAINLTSQTGVYTTITGSEADFDITSWISDDSAAAGSLETPFNPSELRRGRP